MAESDERIRELYTVAYSLPGTTRIIQDTITGKLEDIFKDFLPDLETRDFYKKEIAEAIKFVSRFDFDTIAKQTIQNMLDFLEGKTKQRRNL